MWHNTEPTRTSGPTAVCCGAAGGAAAAVFHCRADQFAPGVRVQSAISFLSPAASVQCAHSQYEAFRFSVDQLSDRNDLSRSVLKLSALSQFWGQIRKHGEAF